MSTRREERSLLLLLAIAALAGAALLLLVSMVFVSPERTSDYLSTRSDETRLAQGLVAIGCFCCGLTAVAVAAGNLRHGRHSRSAGFSVLGTVVLGVVWVVIVGTS